MPQSARPPGPSRLIGGARSYPIPVALLLVLMLGWAVPAAADPPAAKPSAGVAAGAGPTKPGYSRLVNFGAVLQPALVDGDAARAVFVQLSAVGAAQVWSATLTRRADPAAAAVAVRAQRRVVAAIARKIAAAAPTATVLFTVTDALPGIGLLATPAALRVIAGRPDVVKISAIVPKVPTGGGAAAPASSVTGSLDDRLTGAGVRVGVIDTGIDYTRSGLGGTGTTAAYAAARSTDTAAWAPTARVVGGYDFVGDVYDAAPTTATAANPAYQPVPRPDPNPLDCAGHGTRIATAIAGSGVADDRIFGGSGPVLTPDRLRPKPIAPGVAPQASLFALKVFGCSGATDAVIPALDRALDPNQDGDLRDRLDVVDLSLTNSTAAADDPETAVLDSLAQFGVLPVVAAGSGESARAGSLSKSVRALAVAPAPVGSAAPTDNSTGHDSTGIGATATGALPEAAAGSVDGLELPFADLVAPDAAIDSPVVGSGPAPAAADATAVVAGLAALVRQQRPTWTPEQVKTALMNTAHLPGSASSTPDSERAGGAVSAVEAAQAVTTQVVAYSSTQPGAVSVSFGIVPADVGQEQVVATAAVVVQNTGRSVAQLSLGYLALVDQPGVTYQVSPTSMSLQPGASTLATITMTISPTELRRTPTDGTSPQQRNPLTGLDEARQYTAATRGQVLLTSAQGSLQVPVSAAVRPVSATAAADGTLAGGPALVLSGSGFSLSTPVDPGRAAQQSLLSVLELGYRSPAPPACRTPAAAAVTLACSAGGTGADLAAVGVGRTPATAGDAGYLWFGLATNGDIPDVGTDVLPSVDIDVNGDNTADCTLQVQAVAGTDLLYAMLFDDRPTVATLADIYPVNFNLGDVDTNAADSDVLLIPVDPTALGYRPGERSFPIRYSVTLYSAGGAAESGMAADVTPALAFDVAAPALTTANPLWQDQGGTAVPYRLAPGVAAADALVLHLHGADSQRAQIVRLAG